MESHKKIYRAENFRGIIFAPNSPVQIKGNNKDFNGFIIAQSIIDPAGYEWSKTPTGNEWVRSDGEEKTTLQEFYKKLGLSDAKYDDLDAVKLLIYKNPKKDIVYLTKRASKTR